jgi:uncharacterized Fe-S cluster protein YjdI
MPKKKTNEEFLKEIFNLVKNEYSFLEPYKGSQIKIKVKHNICNHEYSVTPDRFINGGTRCPSCFLKKNTERQTKTHEKFVEEVYELVEENYTVLTQYTHNKTKIKMLHNSCNTSFEVRPYAFLHGNSRCPFCFGTPKKTTKQFKDEVYQLVGNEYSVLGRYLGNKKKIKMKHNICNHE